MSHPIIRALAHVALSAVALQATAQGAPRAARPDPLDARAAVPATSYESVLSKYRRFGDEPAVSWRQANDTTEAIGGWRTYAREAQSAASAPARPPTVRATP